MLEHPAATNFCNLIMHGEWDKVNNLIYEYLLFKLINFKCLYLF